MNWKKRNPPEGEPWDVLTFTAHVIDEPVIDGERLEREDSMVL